MGGAAASAVAATAAAEAQRSAAAVSALQLSERRKGWEKTGIIALRGLGLQAIPPDLLTGFEGARVCDGEFRSP
jgi:hypothetical protein